MMNETEAKDLVARAGRMLLSEGLVARTWGNVSCRIDENRMAITPSGLAYENMTADDVVCLNMSSGEWEGRLPPSSEKGVHIAAYRGLDDGEFVIHTHQVYASAIGLTGIEDLSLSVEEESALGGIAMADYGLPGTKKLAQNVAAALRGGAHSVLLARHGAVIVGKDHEETFQRARLLETVCRRACMGQPADNLIFNKELAENLVKYAKNKYEHVAFTSASPVLACADGGKTIRAQLDDMAQMIGPRLPIVRPDEEAIVDALVKKEAVLVPGVGAICRAFTDDDSAAMCLLAEKACISWLHTQAMGINKHLSWLDTRIMRSIYLKKYSKMTGG
ncbi:class II aldolase/adducin family protein [Bacillota bacterium]